MSALNMRLDLIAYATTGTAIALADHLRAGLPIEPGSGMALLLIANVERYERLREEMEAAS